MEVEVYVVVSLRMATSDCDCAVYNRVLTGSYVGPVNRFTARRCPTESTRFVVVAPSVRC
jgi:hypothetical protein